MRYCKTCDVKIENDNPSCPLCHNETETISESFAKGYPSIKISLTYDLIKRLLLFLCTGGSVVCLFINRFAGEFPWSFICIAAYFYLYFSAKTILRRTLNVPFIVLVQVFLISIVAPIVDFSIGFTGWSVNFVIPFIIISGSITLYVFSKLDLILFNEYIVYLLILAIIGIIPLVLVFTKIVTIKWPSFACILFSFLSILFMIIFFTRKFKNELIKRLHF